MTKTIIMLPDGTELSSGVAGTYAIESVTLTQNINEDYELTPGTVSADALELTVLTQGETLPVEAGDRLTVFEEDGTGGWNPVGVFLAEKPTFKSANRLGITAYDAVSLLDKDLTGWLAELTGWPYTLEDFAMMVCEECGAQLQLAHCINQGFSVEKFTAANVTGRHLMRWICQAGGAFCRADSQGTLYLGWYTNRGVTLAPGGSSFYYQGSLSHADYTVSPVTRVCLRQTGDDVGISYPETADPDNPWVITGNPLLASNDTEALRSVAQNLYEQMSCAAYTPCKVCVPATLGLMAGDAFTVTDPKGVTVTGLVMSRVRRGGRDTVQCTGSFRRSDPAAKNTMSYHALSGKVLNLQTSVDGIKAENSDSAGKMAQLELTVSGISAEVSQQSQRADYLEQDLSRLDQQATKIEMSVQSLQESEELTREQVAQLTLQSDSIRAEVSSQSQRTGSLEQDFSRLDQQASEIELTVQSLQESEELTHEQVAQLTLQSDSIRAEVSSQSQRTGSLEQDFSRLDQQATEIELTVQSLQESEELTHEQVAQLTLQSDSIRAEVSSQSQRTGSLEQDFSRLDQQASEIELTVQSLQESEELTHEQVAQLSIQSDSIRAEVSRQDRSLQEMSRDLTTVEQTARHVQISVQSIQESGVSRVQTETGYTFGADGLRIKKAGQEIENLLDEAGMTVSRGDTVMLRADKDGVLATDVTVRNYLIVGSHARFEDHSDGRTACFYL